MSNNSPAQDASACPFTGAEPLEQRPPARTVPVAPGRLPMIGHMWPLMRNPFDFFADLRARGDMVKIYIGKRPIYVFTTARLAHQVLVKDARSFGKGMVWEAVHPLSGNGLLASDRALHRRQRRLIQPLFHRKMIASYAQIMTAESQALAESWQPGQQVVVQKAMIELTLTTIARSMFSGSLPRDVVQEIIRSLPIFTYGMVARTVLPAWLCKVSGFDRRFLGAADRLRAAVDHVVRTDKSADGADLLSHLRAARDPDTDEAMSEDLIRDELVSIMMAGTETTAATLTWAFHEISQHPEVEEKLRAELQAVLGGRPAEYDDIEKLSYTPPAPGRYPAPGQPGAEPGQRQRFGRQRPGQVSVSVRTNAATVNTSRTACSATRHCRACASQPNTAATGSANSCAAASDRMRTANPSTSSAPGAHRPATPAARSGRSGTTSPRESSPATPLPRQRHQQQSEYAM